MSDPAPKPKRTRRAQPLPESVVPPTPTEMLPSRGGGISALASANAPFLYFDGAPNFGFNNGIANVTLEAVRFNPVEGDIIPDRVAVAHLRMSLKAAESLKSALEKVLLLARPAASRERN